MTSKTIKQILLAVLILVVWWVAGPIIAAAGLATPVSIVILVILLGLGALYTGLYGTIRSWFKK